MLDKLNLRKKPPTQTDLKLTLGFLKYDMAGRKHRHLKAACSGYRRNLIFIFSLLLRSCVLFIILRADFHAIFLRVCVCNFLLHLMDHGFRRITILLFFCCSHGGDEEELHKHV